jgi:hypothetical protein
LPNYVLPLYPALLLLAAAWLVDTNRPSLTLWQRMLCLFWGLLGTALAVAIIAAPVPLQAAPLWSLTPLALLVFALGWAPPLLMWRQQPRRAALLAIPAAIVGYAVIFAFVMPRLTPLWISSRIVAQLPRTAPLAAAGFNEPSLIFLKGTQSLITDGAGAADFLAAHADGWAAVERASDKDFQARLKEIDIDAEPGGEIDGFNYSRGRPALVTLWHRRQG